jgi:hypothetical protein
MIAAISMNKVEGVQMFYKGGTTSEVFADFMNLIVQKLRVEYKNKRFLFIMDNLSSHKTSEVRYISFLLIDFPL